MNNLLNHCIYRRLGILFIFVLSLTGYGVFSTTVASAASLRSRIPEEYFVYTKRNTVIANKAEFGSTRPIWVRDTFVPQITTNGVGCDSKNDVEPHDFDSYIKFYNCDGLKIEAKGTPAANKQWFQDVNMSYLVGDFDNSETINIGRGFIVGHGRSALGNPDFKQKAEAEKVAKITTGSNKYDCDNPNPNTSDDCSLVILFTNGDPGVFHITLDDNNYKDSIHEYWYEGAVTRPYHTLIFNPNGDGASVVENHADGQMLVTRTSGVNLLRDYDGSMNGKLARITATGFPTPTRSGYVFRGWSTSQNGDCQASHNCVISQPMGNQADGSGNITLYAHWAIAEGGYVLAPHVNTPVDAVKQGDTVTFTPSVTKDNSTDSNNTNWKFCRVLVAPGASAPAAGAVCSDPGATLVESKDGVVFSGSGPFAIGDPANYTYTVPAGTLYGSQVCYALLVDSSTQEAGHPAESVKCVIVAKTPHLQVWGNDARVGSSYLGWDDNNMSLISVATGSWGEYGVIAPDTISGFGSGSVKNGTLLTFANRPALGGFTQATSVAGLGTIPDVQTYLEKAGSAVYRGKTGINLVDAPATIGAYAANTVYTSDGTVTIDGDIINPSKGDSLSQMVIIADNINILPNVKQVDAWLIATNTINTCYLNGDTPKIGNCGDNTNASTLHINGPVMAKSLILNRTGGLDTDDNSASEVINLRGDAYIWMHKLSTETGSIRTVYTRELAPRY